MRARTYGIIAVVSLILIVLWLHIALIPQGGLYAIIVVFTNPGNVLWWVLPAFALFGTAYALRALRWWVLLRPFHTKKNPANLFPILVGGIFLTYVSPLRAGDIATPYWLRQKSGTRFTAGLASVIWARLLDFASLLLIILISAISLYGAIVGEVVVFLRTGILVGVAFVVFFVLIRSKRIVGRLSRLAGRLFKPSKRLQNSVPSFVENFAADLHTDISSWNSGWAFLLSIPIWMLETMKLTFIGLVFGVHLSFVQSSFVAAISYMSGHLLAIILPAGIGIFVVQTVTITRILGMWDIAAAASIALLDGLVYIIGLAILGVPSISTMGRGYLDLLGTEETPEMDD